MKRADRDAGSEGDERLPEHPGDVVDAQLSSLAALGDPVRRALYRYVAAQPDAVTRDDAAAGVVVARHVAKFHLDRLVAGGLLEVEYARPPDRRGPGAGRPAKRYRRASREVGVSLPARDYELAGQILATAIAAAERDGIGVDRAVADTARQVGRAAGGTARAQLGKRPSRAEQRAAVVDALGHRGYEPRVDGDGTIRMANCPFHALAEQHTQLVCGMNLELLHGLVEGVGEPGLEPRLAPVAGWCCVLLDPERRR